VSQQSLQHAEERLAIRYEIERVTVLVAICPSTRPVPETRCHEFCSVTFMVTIRPGTAHVPKKTTRRHKAVRRTDGETNAYFSAACKLMLRFIIDSVQKYSRKFS
jgi:hypothetical protein